MLHPYSIPCLRSFVASAVPSSGTPRTEPPASSRTGFSRTVVSDRMSHLGYSSPPRSVVQHRVASYSLHVIEVLIRVSRTLAQVGRAAAAGAVLRRRCVARPIRPCGPTPGLLPARAALAAPRTRRACEQGAGAARTLLRRLDKPAAVHSPRAAQRSHPRRRCAPRARPTVAPRALRALLPRRASRQALLTRMAAWLS